LGDRYFGKNLMLGLAAAAGLAAEKVVDLSDEKYRARSLVERLFGNYAAPMADPSAWVAATEATTQDQAQAAQVKQLIRATYAQGNVVVVGRGGQVVLRDLPDSAPLFRRNDVDHRLLQFPHLRNLPRLHPGRRVPAGQYHKPDLNNSFTTSPQLCAMISSASQ